MKVLRRLATRGGMLWPGGEKAKVYPGCYQQVRLSKGKEIICVNYMEQGKSGFEVEFIV